MSNLSQRFNNLSLYKKILLILSTTLLFVFFAFVVGIQLLSQYYARELYTSNAQSLNYVSSFVSARMETVESGSARILSDTIIQTNLTDIMDAPTSIRNAQRKQTIYQALYPYIFDDDYIKSISLVLPDDTLICMGNTSDLDAFPSVLRFAPSGIRLKAFRCQAAEDRRISFLAANHLKALHRLCNFQCQSRHGHRIA